MVLNPNAVWNALPFETRNYIAAQVGMYYDEYLLRMSRLTTGVILGIIFPVFCAYLYRKTSMPLIYELCVGELLVAIFILCNLPGDASRLYRIWLKRYENVAQALAESVQGKMQSPPELLMEICYQHLRRLGDKAREAKETPQEVALLEALRILHLRLYERGLASNSDPLSYLNKRAMC